MKAASRRSIWLILARSIYFLSRKFPAALCNSTYVSAGLSDHLLVRQLGVSLETELSYSYIPGTHLALIGLSSRTAAITGDPS